MQRSSAPAAGAGRIPDGPAGEARRRVRRRGVRHDPEVLPRGEGGPAPTVVRPPQHRRDRRRGAPQPVRLHRRLCPPHARCAAQCVVHRLYGHARRTSGRQHPGRVRRLHQCLRHPARRRRTGDGAIYYESRLAKLALDESARPNIDPDSRKRPKARKSNARNGSRPGGRSSKPSWGQGNGCVSSPRTSSPTSTTAPKPWKASDGRVHEPPHLR